MEKITALFLLCSALFACETVDYAFDDQPGTEPVTGVSPLYSTAISYPEGYNWRRDSLGGNVDADVLFMKDGVEMIRVKASAANEVSVDPDSHHIIGGHLYLSFSNNSHTVIKKDGIEMLRFEGSEKIRSLIITDTATYTLGTQAGRAGWTFRKNGEAIISSPSGKLLGGLHQDSDSVCFGAAVPIEGMGSGAAAWRYFLVKNGVAQQLRLGEDIAEILAVRSHRGQQHLLGRMKEGGGLIWRSGQFELLLNSGDAIPWRDCYFVLANDRLYAHVQMKFTSHSWTDMFFLEDKSAKHSYNGCEVYALCENATCLCYACIPSGRASPVSVSLSDAISTFPPQYCMICPFALATDGKKYAIGLNDADDNYRPVLVRGKDTTRFDFNGYFTGLYLP